MTLRGLTSVLQAGWTMVWPPSGLIPPASAKLKGCSPQAKLNPKQSIRLGF